MKIAIIGHKRIPFERLDAGLLLTEGVPDEKDTTAVRFIGRLYTGNPARTGTQSVDLLLRTGTAGRKAE